MLYKLRYKRPYQCRLFTVLAFRYDIHLSFFFINGSLFLLTQLLAFLKDQQQF